MTDKEYLQKQTYVVLFISISQYSILVHGFWKNFCATFIQNMKINFFSPILLILCKRVPFIVLQVEVGV